MFSIVKIVKVSKVGAPEYLFGDIFIFHETFEDLARSVSDECMLCNLRTVVISQRGLEITEDSYAEIAASRSLTVVVH